VSFSSVGEWYEDFAPVPDAAVAALLRPGPSG
jgi:predicted phosphoribosyltransferase